MIAEVKHFTVLRRKPGEDDWNDYDHGE